MVKQRMASADVAGEVSCLKQKILGLRLANIYDLNAKTYVLKLSKSGSDGEKVFLLLESGSRFHTVQVMYDKPDAPSNFTLKLRKHLRTRRLEDVRQLGVDRVVDFVFGCGENAHHLILEMYAQGNVILTDHSYQVLTLLRSHRDDAKGLSIMAKHPYPMHAIRLRQPLPMAALQEALATAAAPPAAADSAEANGAAAGTGAEGAAAADDDDDEGQLDEDAETAAAAAAAAAVVKPAAGGKQGKQHGWKAGVKAAGSSGPTLKSVIADLVPYGPAIAEHCCLAAGLVPGQVLRQQQLTEEQALALFSAVQQFEAWLASLDQGGVAEGFMAALPAPAGSAAAAAAAGKTAAIDAKDVANGASASGDGQQQQGQQQQQRERGAGLVYQDYNPLRLSQLSRAKELLDFPSFDDALDEFYSKIQGQRVQVAKLEAERSALSRLVRIKSDQGARATALEKEAAASELRADLIEYNLEAVDAALDAVNAAIATGMDWRELEALIREERRAGNPVAGAIHSLQLDQNKVTLLLSNLLDGEEDDEEALTRPATKVQVELAMSAYSNAAAHHAARKRQMAKQEKTLAAHAEALKAAEKKAAVQLANLRNSATTAQVVRKAAWFERFHWFISSENYLVISGRDAQQNELIVKRYFRKEDIYVHAELHGASSTIIRNHDPSRPVPPLTLQQAGCACVCRSRAWDSKVVTSAWWVHHQQVSKTAPTGEYLPTGSFMVRGKKQFLPPQGLVMGFGFMFKLEESCIGHHAGERAVRGYDEDDDQQQQQHAAGGRGLSAAAVAAITAAAEDCDDGSTLESSASGVTGAELSAAGSSSMSALDSFLDLSADQLAAAGSRNSRAGSSSVTGPTAAAAAAGGAGFERYGLEHPASAAEGGDEDDALEPGQQQAAKGEGKRYISAAERAKMKKDAKGASNQQQLPRPQPQPPAQQQQQQQQKGQGKGGGKPPAGPGAAAAAAMAAAAAAAAAGPKGRRGKAGKAAKAKEKYAEQDEEDRELALQVLGSAGQKKTRQERRLARKSAKEEARTARSGGPAAPENQQEAIAKATGSQFTDLKEAAAGAAADEQQQQVSSSSADSGEGEDEGAAAVAAAAAASAAGTADAAGGQQRQQAAGASSAADGGAGSSAADAGDSSDAADDADEALAAAADEAERAEINALLAEENVAELPYEEGDAAAAALKELDSLTGIPRADDVLMYAVPVVGPYAALANYKFKVKLTPGTLKKGKAVKQAVELLARGQEALQRERELMRAVPDADMVNAMVGTVKISAAGLQQLKQASKKAKKSAAQSRNAGQ